MSGLATWLRTGTGIESAFDALRADIAATSSRESSRQSVALTRLRSVERDLAQLIDIYADECSRVNLERQADVIGAPVTEYQADGSRRPVVDQGARDVLDDGPVPAGLPAHD